MKEPRRYMLLLPAGLAMCLAAGIISSDVPLARDQGVALLGAHIISGGGSPYKDLFYFNLPGNFFVYLPALSFSPHLAANVCWLDILFLAGSGLALFAAGRRAFSPRVGALAAFFFWLFALAYGHSYWNQAQKETLAILPLNLGLWALAGLSQTARAPAPSLRRAALWAAIFGVCAGLAFQFKPTLGIVLPAVLFAVAAGRSIRLYQVSGAAAGAGFLFALLPLLLFLRSQDALPAAREGIFLFGGHYGKMRVSGLKALTSAAAPMLVGSFLLLTSIPAVAKLRKDPALALCALFGALLAVQLVLQMKFFHYQFLPLLAPFCLLSAHSVETFFFNPNRSRLWKPALAGLLLLNLIPGWQENYAVPLSGRTAYLELGGGIDRQASDAVAEYLRAHSQPSDPVVVFGLEPGLYLQADRYPPTRFVYDLPLVAEGEGDPEFLRHRENWRKEFIEDLVMKPPLYIVINQNDKNPTEPVDSLTQARGFEAFRKLLERSYHLETRLGNYNVFVRNSAGMTSRQEVAGR